jgi:hypothetical protein
MRTRRRRLAGGRSKIPLDLNLFSDKLIIFLVSLKTETLYKISKNYSTKNKNNPLKIKSIKE